MWFKTNTPLLKVDEPKTGQSYHVSWAKNGCVWKLVSVDGDSATMVTPKTKKRIVVKVEDLRHTRKNQIKLNP